MLSVVRLTWSVGLTDIPLRNNFVTPASSVVKFAASEETSNPDSSALVCCAAVSGVVDPRRPPMLLPPNAAPLFLAEMIEARNTMTFSAMRLSVAYPGTPLRVAPNAVRTGLCVRRPSATHSGHWCPTDAIFMQSGQIGRSHRVHRT